MCSRDKRPFAFFVELADHPRTHVLAPVVEFLLQLVFEERALFLDHQDFVQPFGEAAHAFGLERPDHAHLVEPDADLPGQRLVDAQVIERLAHVGVGLARGDDAQPRVRRIDDDAIEPVGAAVGEGGVELEVQQPVFLHQRRIGPADVEAVGRHLEIGRQADLDAMRIAVDRCGGLDRIGDGLERHPATRVAR